MSAEWIPFCPDKYEMAKEFLCSRCHGSVRFTFADFKCLYNFCPWCGEKTEEDEVKEENE